MWSPGSAIAFALFFSVVKESDAQEKSHAKVSYNNSIPIQENTTRRKKIEKEKPQGAYVLNLSSPSLPESSASCAYYCYVLSCALTIPVFTLGLLVKIQQQKRWRSEQRQRFLCCTHTEGSSASDFAANTRLRFCVVVRSLAEGGMMKTMKLSLHLILSRISSTIASTKAYDLLDAKLMPEYR